MSALIIEFRPTTSHKGTSTAVKRQVSYTTAVDTARPRTAFGEALYRLLIMEHNETQRILDALGKWITHSTVRGTMIEKTQTLFSIDAAEYILDDLRKAPFDRDLREAWALEVLTNIRTLGRQHFGIVLR